MNATDAPELRGNYRELPSRPPLFLTPLPTIRSLIFPRRPQSNRIFWVLEALEDSPEVLQVKLVRGKMTLIHRSLWPELLALATSGQPWQTRNLSAAARALLDRTTRAGALRLDELERWSSPVKPGVATRELEQRLLLYTRELHTESGRHTKRLETWTHCMSRLDLDRKLPDAERGREEMERALGPAVAGVPWRAVKRARRAAPSSETS